MDRNKLVVKYVGPGKHNNDVGSIQGNQPVPRSQVVYYYELLVKDKGLKGEIFLGFADKHFKMGRAPGYVVPLPFLRCLTRLGNCCSPVRTSASLTRLCSRPVQPSPVPACTLALSLPMRSKAVLAGQQSADTRQVGTQF